MFKEMIELIKAYGYSKDFDDPQQKKTRYSNETGFIDIWNGKRGVTLGIYNPKNKRMSYYKLFKSINQFEQELIKVK